MKIVHESVFMSSLRAFMSAFFGIIGGVIALAVVFLGIYGLAKNTDESTFSSGVKILPDAEGNRKELGSTAPVILQIHLKGHIGKDQLTGKKIENILLKSRENELKGDRVKGILLVIDSPGGSVNDSDIIYRHLMQYKERYHVPVYAYIDGMCASGGFYISCAADKIFASDVSVVGSVGVLAWPPFMNVSDALDKLGVSSLTLSAGKGKDELNPLRPWTQGEQETYQKLINFYYDRFTDLVVANRPAIDRSLLVNTYGANIFPAPVALENGFIDGSGYSLNDALNQLTEATGISQDEKYQVISFETKNWFKRTFKSSSPMVTGRMQHQLEFPGALSGAPFQLFYY